jgi:predicted site-specific integrase-resolvase
MSDQQQPQIHPPAPAVNPLIKPGALAAQFKVTLTTLRNWENRGLIPPAIRKDGGHRRYTNDHVVAIQKYLGQAVEEAAPSEPR